LLFLKMIAFYILYSLYCRYYRSVIPRSVELIEDRGAVKACRYRAGIVF
jgi:hypothetical protein